MFPEITLKQNIRRNIAEEIFLEKNLIDQTFSLDEEIIDRRKTPRKSFISLLNIPVLQSPIDNRLTNWKIAESSKNIIIRLYSEDIVELSYKFEELSKAIEKSKYILELEDNWDREGSRKYNPSTWKRAILFLSQYAQKVLEKTDIIIATPKIYNGPNGSIDILWKKPEYRLLVNIPENLTMPALFYGDNYKSEKIEGTLDTSSFNPGLFLFLDKR